MSQRNFAINLDDALYQAALGRMQQEGKTLEQVVAELLTTYAQADAEQLTTYTVQSGDSLAKIAQKLYSDPYKYPEIQRANNLSDPGKIWVGQVLIIPTISGAVPSTPSPTVKPVEPPSEPDPPAPEPDPPAPPPPVSEPVEPAPAPQVDPCEAISDESYGTLPIVGAPTDRPAAQHGDINLALRGFSRTEAEVGLIDISGPTDNRAPQLAGLFGDDRTGIFTAVYRVNHWDWGSNSRGGPITDFDVTLAGLQVKPGETIHVPGAGYDIGQGYQVLVLYADEERITLKYTGEDTAGDRIRHSY